MRSGGLLFDRRFWPSFQPSSTQSGKHRNVTYRRGCNKQLRAALVDWAQDTPRANAWAHDTYYRARARGCRHPHAARILAQGWTRILWRCWHDNTPYNPELHGRLSTLEMEAA
ncbi:transposase [Mycolicibacterium sp. D3]